MQSYVATGKKDATGHTVYGDIGTFMRDTRVRPWTRTRPCGLRVVGARGECTL